MDVIEKYIFQPFLELINVIDSTQTKDASRIGVAPHIWLFLAECNPQLTSACRSSAYTVGHILSGLFSRSEVQLDRACVRDSRFDS